MSSTPPATDRHQTDRATARAVLDLLLPLRRDVRSHEHRPAECFAPQLAQITSFVRDGAPLLLTLPSFPCKSPNPRKVLGHLPDYGELLALRSLQRLCLDIAKVYPPGAELLICSDGHVFADLIRVPDQHVTEYIAALRRMIAREQLDRLRIYTLDDVVRLRRPPSRARPDVHRVRPVPGEPPGRGEVGRPQPRALPGHHPLHGRGRDGTRLHRDQVSAAARLPASGPTASSSAAARGRT